MTLIENAIIAALGDDNITAYAKADAPGVYVDDKKIASLGLRVRKSCTFHGLALNVNMDLSPFLRINPCGYAGLEMTQTADLNGAKTLTDAGQLLIKHLTELLEEDKFKTFFDKYMSSWLDIKCSITYMHLYRQFKIKYQELNNEELDKNLAVYLLSKIMSDKNLRPWSIKTVDKMLDNKKMDFFKEFETLMLANNEIKLLTLK